MAFHDVSLPEGLQYGSTAGAGFNTIVTETSSGHETRVARQAQGRHRFRLLKQLQDEVEAKDLKAFALGRRGSLHSFRLKDFSDYTTNDDGKSDPTALDQIIGSGDGSDASFQLRKVYDDTGDAPYIRPLQLPVAGTVLVAVNSVPTTSFTVNGEGIVTLTTTPDPGDVITAGCKFEVPVRFERGFDEWAQMQADAFETWSFVDIGCIEDLSAVESPERANFGGGRDWGTTAQNLVLSLNDGVLQDIEPTASISVFLPPMSRVPGGRIFTIITPASSTGTIQIRDHSGTAVGSAFGAGLTKFVGLVRSGSTGKWRLHG